MAKLHVKRGDNVMIIAGKDKGKTGKILLVNPSKNTVVVEGANIIAKHKKPRSAQDKGGIMKKEGPMHSSNVQVLDPVTKLPTRVYHKLVDGKNVRVSKQGNVLDSAYSAKKAPKKAAKPAEKATETTEKVAKVEKPATTTKTTKTTAKPATKASTTKKPTATKTAETKKATSTKAAVTKTAPRVRNQER